MYIRINPDKIDYNELEKAVDCLRNDGVIIYPTDTVYAIGCTINNTKGFERIAKIKKLKPEKLIFQLFVTVFLNFQILQNPYLINFFV